MTKLKENNSFSHTRWGSVELQENCILKFVCNAYAVILNTGIFKETYQTLAP